MPPRLIFAYKADSGLFNTVTDIAHKLFSPQTYRCQLCALTHAPFAMRREWKRFVESLEPKPEFLHRDELAERFPDLRHEPPLVLAESENGTLTVCLDAAAIESCRSLAALEQLITGRCLADSQAAPENARPDPLS